MRTFFKNIGPGPLVAAASLARYSYGLYASGRSIWLYLAMGYGFVGYRNNSTPRNDGKVRAGYQKGLSEVIRQELSTPLVRGFSIILILSAIVIGNAAYQGGNISGGVLGLETLFGASSINLGHLQLNSYSLIIGVIAFVLLYTGNYKIIERFLVFWSF